MIHSLIFALLTGQGAGEALAGTDLQLAGDAIQSLNGLAQGRVYPHVAPQGTPYPYLVYLVPSTPVDDTFCGLGAQAPAVQVDCWSTSLQQALQIREAALAALAPLEGGDVLLLEDRDNDTGAFRATLELRVWL
ncbi:MAG: hypothetical protein CL549_15750 [Alcanivorax sp.]|nr:hypothetical protein [Alcanivorax sp.]MAY11913.1 hypothetical protein [Alcanivorax sp.]MBI56771.1 hypothetical protein [Alcanivorax sp.]MBM1145638.1 DUF3168 domain-containing protein [Alcanivorax sp. ZXX171]|tara:strand:- start:324 stop:725 length:402 start_codon:yes stop_codon:yes gene_type:complete